MTLWHLLHRWKWLAATTIAGTLIAMVIAVVQKPRYVANMTISSLGFGESAIQAGISGGGTGVLQALKGITGGSAASLSDGDYGYFISLLTSDRTAELIQKDVTTLKLMFPSEWGGNTLGWRRPAGWTSGFKSIYNNLFFGAGYTAPNVPRIKERLDDIMSIRFDIENNHHIISVKSTTCSGASFLASKIFLSADQILKAEKASRYLENIDYLTAELDDQRNSALREELTSALLLQHMHQISARSQLPLAVRVIDGPGCGPRPALPQPFAYLLLGALAGLTLGVFFILARYLVSSLAPMRNVA